MAVGGAVDVLVAVGGSVRVGVSVNVGGDVMVRVGVAVGVRVSVAVDVRVGVAVRVGERVIVGVRVGVEVDSGVAVDDGLAVDDGVDVEVVVAGGAAPSARLSAAACSLLSDNGTLMVLEPGTVAMTAPVISSVTVTDAGNAAGQNRPRSMLSVALAVVAESLKTVR